MRPNRQKHLRKVLVATLALSLLSYASQLFPFIYNPVTHANSFAPGSEIEGTVYAVTTANTLISFNAFTPSALIRTTPITGLAADESVLSIDFRPRTGQLFALGSTSRVYIINTRTGVATAVGSAQFNPALSGTAFDLDFNPTVDRIRLVSDADQNLRLNPDTGAVAMPDATLTYASGDANANANPNIVAAAYTDNFNATTVTTLYGIDATLNTLVRQGSLGSVPVSPNTGQLFTVGALGVDTTEQAGLDISAPGDTAYASLTAPNATTSSLYSINLNTGAATLIGNIGGTNAVRDIAVVTRTETIFAVNANNQLLSFNSGTPGTPTVRGLTGLAGGETIVGMDFRPATGQLFAVTSASRVYTINTQTGAVSPVSGAPLSTPLNGTAFGFDFNPTVDRIRVVSGAAQNLRLNPNNGGIAGTDTALVYATGDPNAGATPNIVGSAYTANVAGATTTTIFGIDATTNTLVLQGSPGGTPNSPNGGQLTTVGALGVDTNDQVGFDIAPQTGAAFASLTPTGTMMSGLFAINTTTGAATLIGNIGGGSPITALAIGTRVELVYALTTGNRLVSFNSLTPGTPLSMTQITGLAADESILGIDFRPATGQLFGLGSNSRLYTINPVTGVATPVGAPFTASLSGNFFGFDFNPQVDRIRVVSGADQDLRLNPDTGAVAGIDMPLVYAAGDPNAGANPLVVAAAYTNNTAGTTSTTLFNIDANLDILVRQGSAGSTPVSPNSGQLFTVGPLGVNTTTEAGFDISDCGNAYASLTTMGAMQSQFYTINLATGAATAVGNIGVNEVVRGIAVATTFTPSAQQAGVVALNAASYAGDSLAPDTVASLFGNFQTMGGGAFNATSMPLPTTLGGVRVTVGGQDARLFFVSNSQINFMVPAGLSDGPATVIVTNANGTTSVGMIMIARATPGIFTANQSGRGTAAALATPDGVSFTPIINPDGTERPINPGTAANPTWLMLFATGLRNVAAANPNDANGVAESVTVTFNGVPSNVTYAGPAPGFAGLDQINAIIPPGLAGAGQVTVRVTVGGQEANPVTVTIGGTTPMVVTQDIAVGQTITGALSTDDQVQTDANNAYFFDAYRFTATAGQAVAIDVRSTAFDAVALLYRRAANGALTLVAADDDLGGLGDGAVVNGNALLFSVLEAGDYVLYVSSAIDAPRATGAYTVRLVGNAAQAINYGATINGSLAAGDVQTAAGVYLDAYSFTGAAGDRVQIRMSSSAFDSFLLLNSNDGDFVIADDNSGGGQSALVDFTLPAAGTYVIIATSFAPNRTGDYTLTLTRVTSFVGDLTAEATAPGRASAFTRDSKAKDAARFAQFAARQLISQ
jgi:uncharacterized protein (TIGR03437 family)